MNTKLITALRTAAAAVENRTFNYEWSEPGRCNCGVVVCALLGKSGAELDAMLERAHPGDGVSSLTWEARVGRYCPITGIPNDAIFQQLFSFGLTQIDIVQLEDLSNQEVLARLPNLWITVEKRGLFRRQQVHKKIAMQCDNPDDLVAYLRAWADLLAERGTADVPAIQEVLKATT